MISALRFQPVFSLAQQRIIGYEILSAIGSDLCCEDYFSSLDRDSHLGLLIRQLTLLATLNSNARYYINIPVILLSDSHAMSLITLKMKRNIIIELQDPENIAGLNAGQRYRLLCNLKHIQRVGYEVWLDDLTPDLLNCIFSLGFIFSGLKIDKYAFWKQSDDPAEFISFICRCHLLSNNILMEGIENHSQYHLATSCGASYLQGFYWPEHRIEFSG
jgi:EAL domain-containing protein (putative c-di-GMP-specific phosphodiesterase class I)